MSNDIQRNRNRNEFFINRRRDSKSKKSLDTKEIFTRYAKKNDKFSEIDIIQSKRVKKKIILSNDAIVYDNKNIVDKL